MGAVALKVEDLPHYTYDHYAQWEGRWEVINGLPYAMTPAPTIEHQDLCVNIVFQLKRLLRNCGRCKVLLPVDWQISEDTVVQPDVLVVCGEVENIKGNKLLIPPVLVFEILSPATVKKDRGLKYRLYQAAGVKYYCMVDPETKSADVFELRGEDKYIEKEDFQEGKVTFDLGACKIAFDFAEIFKGTS